jgi:hypothetical protein
MVNAVAIDHAWGEHQRRREAEPQHRPCSLLEEESKQQMLERPTPEVLAMLPWIALVETKLV